MRGPLGLGALVVLACVCTACTSHSAGRSAAVAEIGASTVSSASSSPQAADGQGIDAVWPVGPATAWVWTGAATGTGAQALQRTVDGGASWTNVTPPGLAQQSDGDEISGVFALDAAHAWVTFGPYGSAAAQTLTVTADGGRHWHTDGNLPSTGGCQLQFVTPGDGWCISIGAAAGSEGVFLWRTTDGGQHWRQTLTNSPNIGAHNELPFGCDKLVGFDSTRLGWAGFHCAGGPAPLYRSVDGGARWTSVDLARPPGSLDDGDGFIGIPVLNGADGAVGFRVDGSSPAAATTLVYRSSDGGTTWQPVTPPGPRTYQCVDTVTATSWRLIAGDQLVVTDDAGRTWHTTTMNQNFGQLACGGAEFGGPEVDFTGEGIGWITYARSPVPTTLWRTTDGGTTWTRLAVPGTA